MEWNNALGSVLGLSDTKKADRRIAEIARSAFGADGASRRVTLSGFLTDLVVDPEVQKAGWDHSKAPDLVNAANYFALALNFSAIDDPFLKNEDSDLAVAGWLHERIGKIRKGEDRREFLVDLISRRISPWSDDIDEDNSGQIFYAVIELEWYRNHDEDFDFLAANKPISMWEMCLDCFEKASVRNLCGNEVQETFEVWRDSELTKARCHIPAGSMAVC